MGAQMANNDVVNFSGTWKLRTSEKLDEFLKSEGWGFVMRKAAGAANAKQTIVQDEKSIKLKIETAKGTYSYEAPLDETEIKYTDMDKDECTSTSKLSDDKQSIIETIIKGKDKKKTQLHDIWRIMKCD